jgi:hypothetical protein
LADPKKSRLTLKERRKRLEALPENSNPEIRRKLLEIGQAGDRARFEQSKNTKRPEGNPLFPLFAIGRYRADEELPLWIRQWLLDFARRMLRATLCADQDLDAKESSERVLAVLGVTHQGWNSVDEVCGYLNGDVLAWLHQQGIPERELAAIIQTAKARAKPKPATATLPAGSTRA